MPKYAPATGLRDISRDVPLTDDQVYRGTTSVFGQGLRAGLAEAGGNMNSLAGQVAEGFGANDLAASQRASAVAAQENADRLAPRMSDWHDIGSVGDAGNYLAGSAGRMVPALGAGIAGATALGVAAPSLAGGALIGATLGTAPQMIGAEFQRQQANPEALKQDFTDRTLTGIGAGTANAALSNVVPQIMGGKLIGRGVANAGEHAIAQASKKAILAKNLSEGVLGNGLAGVGSEAVNQAADTHYDPNRDTSQDNQHMIDAGIGGAIIGAPFGAIGMAGELAHRRGPASTGGILNKIKDYANDKFTKEDGTRGVDLGGAKEWANSTAEWAKKSAIEKASDAKKWAEDLYKGDALTDEMRANLEKWSSTITDPISQKSIAAMKFASEKYDGVKGEGVLSTLNNIRAQITEASQNVDGTGWPAILDNIGKVAGTGFDAAKGKGYDPIIAKVRVAMNDLPKSPEGLVDYNKVFQNINKAVGEGINSAKDIGWGDVGTAAGKTVKATSDAYSRMRDMLGGKNEPVDLTTARDIAAGKDPIAGIDPEVLASAAPEAQQAMVETATTSRFEQAKKMYSDLRESGSLSDESRAVLDAAGADLSSTANQMKVAGIKLAEDGRAKITTAIDSAYQVAHDRYTKMFKDDGKAKSEVSSGLTDHITNLLTPALEKHLPSLKGSTKDLSRLSETLTRVTQLAEKGDVDFTNIRHLHSLLGGSVLRNMVEQVHQVIGQGDKTSLKNFDHVLSKIQGEEISHDRLSRIVAAAHTPEQLKTNMAKYPDYLRTMVDGIRSHVDHSAYEGVGAGPEFRAKRDFDALMSSHFGDRYEGVLKGFEKHIERNGTKVSHIDDRAGPEDKGAERNKIKDSDNDGVSNREVDGELPVDELASSKLTEGNLGDQYEEPTFHGKGDDNAMLLSKGAHNRTIGASESAGERILNERQKKYGGHKNVEFVDFHDLPKDIQKQHMDRLAKARDENIAKDDDPKTARTRALDTHGRPNDVGMVRMEGMRQEGRLSAEDLGMVSIDSKSGAGKKIELDGDGNKVEKNPSAIRTGGGVMVDARKLIRMFQSESRTPFNESDNKGAQFRLARVFMEGVAAVQDHLGKAFDIPDSTVLQVKDWGKPTEKVTTWGDVKGLSHAVIGKEANELTNTLRESSRGELLRMKRGPEKIMSDYDLATSAEFEKRAKRGDKLSKEDAKAIYKAYETPEVKEANSLLFRIESEIDSRSADSLVSEVDSSEKTLSARRQDTIDKKLQAEIARREKQAAAGEHKPDYFDKDGKPRIGDLIKPMTPIEVAKYKKELMSGSVRFDGKEVGNGSGPTYHMQQEIGPDAQPHIARRAKGIYNEEAFTGGVKEPARLSKAEEELVHRTNMDGTAITYANRSTRDGGAETAGKIDKFISRLERSVTTANKELASKIKNLRALGDEMSKYDRDSLGVRLALAEKPADVAGHVENLSKKYLPDATDSVEPSQFGGSTLKKTKALDEKSSEGVVSHSKQIPGTTPITPHEQAAVEKMIKGSLGDGVRVEFGKLFHAGDYERVRDKSGLAHDLMRFSVHNLDPMSVGFHETLHGFIQHMREADLHGVNAALYKAADSIYVRGRMREFLKNEPEALKQIDGPNSSVEERAAYMYQMWAAGKLVLHDAPRNVLEKISDFIKKTLGMWTSNERAQNIMQYLRDGEYAKSGLGDRSAVARALLQDGTNKTFETVKKTLEPLVRVSDNIISAGDNVLASMKNPSIDKIRKLVNANTDDEGQGTGWISAARIAKTTELNGLMTALAKNNVNAEQMHQALEQLQSGKLASSPEAGLLAGEKGPIRQLLDKLHTYATESGVDLGDRGKAAGYFPVVWDTSHIAANQKEFRAMLDKYVRSGKITNPDAIIKTLLSNDGNDFGIETNRPGMEAAKKRKLDFISPEDRAGFLQKDLMMTMSSYVTQITRRAEWAKRFGDDSAGLNRMLNDARHKHGATDEQIATVDKFIKSIDGSLGDNIDPGLRRLFGNAIVYQNLRLLPFAVFSMAVDPGGIMVRGGTMKDAFTAFRRGITEIKRGFDKNPSKDEWYQMAETMGIIDNATLVHTLGTSYSQGMVGDTGRKINDTFFRYNLVEQMNTSMRVAAIPAALSFMAKHADGTKEVHSKRWLSELDLKPGDIVVKDGKPLTTQAEFEAHGMNTKDALAAENRMHLAVNKWVDGAILRPNAAHKPGWMNDPHYALVAHLKQFVYSFNETIIKRVLNEARYGNYTPAYAVASYIPTMMAADFIKGMIVGGGSQPAYKDNWDMADYIGSGVQRSGLLMTSQFGLDAYKNLKMGGTGVQALLGPQIEQLADGIKALGGHESGSSFALDAAPISPIVKAISHSGSSKADPNFAD